MQELWGGMGEGGRAGRVRKEGNTSASLSCVSILIKWDYFVTLFDSKNSCSSYVRSIMQTYFLHQNVVKFLSYMYNTKCVLITPNVLFTYVHFVFNNNNKLQYAVYNRNYCSCTPLPLTIVNQCLTYTGAIKKIE